MTDKIDTTVSRERYLCGNRPHRLKKTVYSKGANTKEVDFTEEFIPDHRLLSHSQL